MPGVMIERPKMTMAMYQALKRHIMRERERLKQAEQEQDKAAERLKKERELKKKKEEENSLTLEQTKEQLGELQTKMETLKKDKHELFGQLKKVLQDDENKKKLKEHNDMVAMQSYHAPMSLPAGHPGTIYMQSHMQPKPAIKYMSVPSAMHHHGGHAPPPPPQASASGQQAQAPASHHPLTAPVAPIRSSNQSMKRQRSPSPTPSQTQASLYQHYAKYAVPTSGASYPGPGVKQEPYSSQPSDYGRPPKIKSEPGVYPTQTTFANQSSHSYPTQATSKPGSLPPSVSDRSSAGYSVSTSQSEPKYGPGQSAFQSYGHYTHQQQKAMAEGVHYQGPSYPVQRMPGFMNSPHTSGASINLQQQLEHANQKSGFAEDKFKMQQQMQQQRPMAPIQHAPPHHSTSSHPPSASAPQQPKGGIVSGYPVRSQPTSYPTSSQNSHPGHSAAQAPPPRHQYQGAGGYQRY